MRTALTGARDLGGESPVSRKIVRGCDRPADLVATRAGIRDAQMRVTHVDIDVATGGFGAHDAVQRVVGVARAEVMRGSRQRRAGLEAYARRFRQGVTEFHCEGRVAPAACRVAIDAILDEALAADEH